MGHCSQGCGRGYRRSAAGERACGKLFIGYPNICVRNGYWSTSRIFCYDRGNPGIVCDVFIGTESIMDKKLNWKILVFKNFYSKTESYIASIHFWLD